MRIPGSGNVLEYYRVTGRLHSFSSPSAPMYRMHEFGVFSVHGIHRKDLILAQGSLSCFLFCFVSQTNSVILAPCSQMQLASVSGMDTVV